MTASNAMLLKVLADEMLFKAKLRVRPVLFWSVMVAGSQKMLDEAAKIESLLDTLKIQVTSVCLYIVRSDDHVHRLEF